MRETHLCGTFQAGVLGAGPSSVHRGASFLGHGRAAGEDTRAGPLTPLPPRLGRRKRSYKQAVSELDEEQQLEDEELQPPRSKTPSPPCPASKVRARCPPSELLSRPRALALVSSVQPPGPDPGLSVPPPGV